MTITGFQEPEFEPEGFFVAETASTAVPHSREAEEAVLGSVFINPEVMDELFDILQPMDFYIHRHGWVWEAMVYLYVERLSIDLLTVADHLDAIGQLDEVGGRAYLTALVNQVPTSLNAEEYARIVESHSVRRQMIETANKIAALAYNEKIPFEKFLSDIDALLEKRPTSTKTTIQTAADSALELQERIESGKQTAIPLGLSVPDADFGGFPIQAVSMFMGDFSSGKTALLLQACEQLNFSGERALYVTLEEPGWKMVSRRVFSNAGVEPVEFRRGLLTPGQKALLKDEIKAYMGTHSKLAFDHQARTVQGIRRSVRQHRAKLVIVDDLLHVDTGRGRNENETMSLVKTVTRLKDIAIDENCAVVLIHHLNSEDSARFSPSVAANKKPTSNVPPSITNIPWASTLRFTVDMWLALLPDFRADITDDVVEMILWLLKDKAGGRMKSEIHLWYSKKEQWWFDRDSKHMMKNASKVSAQVPSQIAMP